MMQVKVVVIVGMWTAAKRNTSLWSYWTRPYSWSDGCWLGENSAVVKALWTLICWSKPRCKNVVIFCRFSVKKFCF